MTASDGQCPLCGQALDSPDQAEPPSEENSTSPEALEAPATLNLSTISAVPIGSVSEIDLSPATDPDTTQVSPAATNFQPLTSADQTARDAYPIKMRPERIWWHRPLAVGLVVVLLLALVGGGTFYFVQAHISGQSSNLAAAQPTATAMPTPRPTATPRPTVAPPSGPQLVTTFYDSLANDRNGWPNNGNCRFESDGYHLVGSSGAFCLAPVGVQGSNGNISVRVKFVVSGGGAVGIAFRSPSASGGGYIFLISSFGACEAVDLSVGYPLFRLYCPSIHKGVNAINTLLIDQNGADMSFYVNGVLASKAEDSNWMSGRIALATTGTTNAVFSDFALTKWE